MMVVVEIIPNIQTLDNLYFDMNLNFQNKYICTYSFSDHNNNNNIMMKRKIKSVFLVQYS